jgi:tRNA threonylcarbamoyl adenosine modification protein YeaZ
MSPPGLTLGISTAGPVEVALIADGLDRAWASDKGALESVAALLCEGLRESTRRIDDITLVGVCTGPGSFTGLRIGVAFAKSLAQSKEIPIIGVSAYDIAAFGCDDRPLVSVARGKRDHYYARVAMEPAETFRFLQGTHAAIEQAAAQIGAAGKPAPVVGPDFSASRPGSAAQAVARLARQAFERGDPSQWTNIAIDYGQRPNAVVNWEKRHGASQEGPPLSRRELPVE